MDLGHYTAKHRRELEDLLAGPEWQEALRSGLVEEVRAARLAPGRTRNFIDTVVNQLLAHNRARVSARIRAGERDEETLLDGLAQWPEGLAGCAPQLSFLGLNLTTSCNLATRCLYCNQPRLPATMTLADWRRLLAEVTESGAERGPYIYITGGEPLLLGEMVWGDEGLVRYATARGAAVNINTNALGLSAVVALRLIKAGLFRLHISLDTADEELQNQLYDGPYFQDILRGIYNLQLAREVVGVDYPVIHTNCVLTNRNLDTFPQLFAFLLSKHSQTADKSHPFFNDLFPHIIPVGGESNAALRPSADEFRRFYGEVWAQVAQLWEEHQARVGVPVEKRGALFGYFANPSLRVQHQGGLEAYVHAAAAGRYGELALARHCYVAPTQAAFTPDGEQFYCGSHAVRRIQPIGNGHERSVGASIAAGLAALRQLPQPEACYGCALATLYTNQAVEAKLRETVSAMLAGDLAALPEATPAEDELE
jgi:sulfatase maturation enzyme AslB (radical SAM superfamily)